MLIETYVGISHIKGVTSKPERFFLWSGRIEKEGVRYSETLSRTEARTANRTHFKALEYDQHPKRTL